LAKLVGALIEHISADRSTHLREQFHVARCATAQAILLEERTAGETAQLIGRQGLC
jgi:hypothetical protein